MLFILITKAHLKYDIAQWRKNDATILQILKYLLTCAERDIFFLDDFKPFLFKLLKFHHKKLTTYVNPFSFRLVKK